MSDHKARGDTGNFIRLASSVLALRTGYRCRLIQMTAKLWKKARAVTFCRVTRINSVGSAKGARGDLQKVLVDYLSLLIKTYWMKTVKHLTGY